jgi:hypothetical protein
MVTSQETLRNLLNDFVPKDKWIYITDIYDIIERNIGVFHPNDFDVLAEYNQQPKWKRNIRNALQTLKTNRQILWDGNSSYLFPSIISEETESSTLPARQGMTESQFLQIQERRKEIGRQGEEFVVDYERKKLVEAGNLELATMVKRVSIDDIGAGYDVLSFTTAGDKKHIEVKTTIGAGNSFEISINEIDKRKVLPNYFIYFIRNFNPGDNEIEPIIISSADIDTQLELIPSSFRATLTSGQ